MCKDKKCNGCSDCAGNQNISAQISELNETIQALSSALAPFVDGHPILLIEEASDIALFDAVTGRGSDYWEQFAFCDGKTHKNSKGKNITTPNFIDKFIIMAGGTYAVDDTGGAASVTLSVGNMPSHTHAVNDPGHTHVIDDPGHLHAVNDPGHNHSATSGAHTHTFTTDAIGGHEHSTSTASVNNGGGSAQQVRATGSAPGDSTSTDGAHSHTGTTDSASGTTSIDDAFTGIEVQEAFTGISAEASDTDITLDNTGNGDAVDILNPYYAAIYVMKL